MNRRGTVLVSGELTHMPMLLGDLETLVIDEFPEEAKATWDRQRDLVIEETESGGHFGPRFGPPIPMPGPTETTQHTSKEIVTFTITEVRDDLVRISKKYSLKSGEKDKVTRFDMTGAGEIEFDRKEGMIKKSSMTYEVKVNESGISLTIPITMTSRLFGRVGVGRTQKETRGGRQGRQGGRRRGQTAETLQVRRAARVDRPTDVLG